MATTSETWARASFERLLRNVSRLPMDHLHRLAFEAEPLLGRVYRRGLVERNLRCAFPDADVAPLARTFYAAYAQCYAEVVRSLSMPAAELRARVTIDGADALAGGNAVLLLAHHGNFVWALTALPSQIDVPVSVVYKPPHIRVLHAMLLVIAQRFAINPVPVREVRRELVKRRARPGIWALVADQRPGDRNRRYAQLCGRRTAFFTGPERIARALRCPVYYLSCDRVAAGRYRCAIERLAEPPYDADDATVVERYAERLQADIDRAPADWLWSHERWREPLAGAVADD